MELRNLYETVTVKSLTARALRGVAVRSFGNIKQFHMCVLRSQMFLVLILLSKLPALN